MSYTLTVESFDGIISSWDKLRHCLKWGSIFILPMWLKVWWEAFGDVGELYLRTLRQGEKIIGFAPLMINSEAVSFIGSEDVSDYLDFAVTAGRERDFFEILLDDLKERGIKKLNLGPVRPDSTVITQLVRVAQNRGYKVLCNPEDVSLELDLPDTWNKYLAALKNKQRHEIRRKLRRLWETSGVEHHCIEAHGDIEDYLDIFLKLFSLSKHDKASFMNQKREVFFRLLAKSMAEVGLLRLGILQLNKVPAAITIGLDYDDSHYLYNSAYDPQFSYLSVGLLCKILCLKESIEKGKKKWNFLKGGEPYKYRLGGQEISLYSCQITIT